MKILATMLIAASLLAVPASGAFAQDRNVRCEQGTSCAQNSRNAPAEKFERTNQNARGAAHSVHRTAPKVGDSARNGARFNPPNAAKLERAPNGREYRVINDRVVLVDSSTMKILRVVGALADLSN